MQTRFDWQAAADIETARKKGIPEGLEIAVMVTEDEAKRKVTVSTLPRKSRITLNEWQAMVLADSLAKIAQKWGAMGSMGTEEMVRSQVVICYEQGKVGISFPQKYFTGSLTDGQISKIVDELIPIMVQKIHGRLQECQVPS